MAFSNGATSTPFYPMPATAKTVAIATIPVREPGSSRSSKSNLLLLNHLGAPFRKLKAKFSGAKEDWRRANEARLQETARREQKALQSLREREAMTPPPQQQQQRRQKSENSQRGSRAESMQRQKNENSNSSQRAGAAAAAAGDRREKTTITKREEPNPQPKPVIVVDEPPEQVGGEEEVWLHARARAKQAPSLGTRAVVASAGKHGRRRWRLSAVPENAGADDRWGD